MGGMTALINADGYTFSGNGTSFSTPIMAGAVACLWQALPQLSCIEIANLVRQNSSQSEYPDSIMGYGIPDMVRAYYGASSQLSRTETGVISVYQSCYGRCVDSCACRCGENYDNGFVWQRKYGVRLWAVLAQLIALNGLKNLFCDGYS